MNADQFFMTGATVDEVMPLLWDHHYSGTASSNIQHVFAWREPGGLFGDFGRPRAAVLYSWPTNRNFPVGSLELVRLVRDDDFSLPLSQFVAWSLRWLKKNARWNFVLSYSDMTHGHHGGIYQACNFTYCYESKPRLDGIRNTQTGQEKHGRQCSREFGNNKLETLQSIGFGWEPRYLKEKHFYIYPLRQKLKRVLSENGWQPKPYPKPDA